MKKRTALALLEGTYTSVARHVGCSKSAVQQWPDPLPRRMADRVLAARLRMEWKRSGYLPQVADPEIRAILTDAIEV